jgi:LysM repeat protein
MTTMTLDTLFQAPTLKAQSLQAQSLKAQSLKAQSLAPRRTSIRLTRRGRVVVVVAALLIAFAIGVFVTAAGSVATQSPGTPAPTRIVQVGSGDTLWAIASKLADDGDVRPMMEQIKQLNALESADLQAGQRLVVPAG